MHRRAPPITHSIEGKQQRVLRYYAQFRICREEIRGAERETANFSQNGNRLFWKRYQVGSAHLHAFVRDASNWIFLLKVFKF